MWRIKILTVGEISMRVGLGHGGWRRVNEFVVHVVALVVTEPVVVVAAVELVAVVGTGLVAEVERVASAPVVAAVVVVGVDRLVDLPCPP